MVLGRIVFVVALTTGTAAAADCAVGDETSFVQVKQSVHQGSERIPNEASGWATPVTDLNAYTDATPDNLMPGSVMNSYMSNKGQVTDQIENEASNRIEFTANQRQERESNYKEAANAVTDDKKAVEAAVAEDKAAVAATKSERAQIKDQAVAQVKDAKYAAEAHAIKGAQTHKAAALGRKIGTIEGQDAVHHAWEDYASQVKSEHEAAHLKIVKEKIAAGVEAKQNHVKKVTAAMKAADESWVARADRAARVAKAKAAAKAAKEEVAIEGPEGLRNHMTDVKADWATLHYDRKRFASQSDIDEDRLGDIGIEQSYIDSAAAGPDFEVPTGLEFSAPSEGLETTEFQKTLAGAE